jgi:hypothetical protein
MSTQLEGIVRPFGQPNVFPTPFNKPSEQGAQLVRFAIGFQGSIKSMGYSFSCTMTSKMGQAHKENSPNNSQSLQRRLGEVGR